MRVTSRGEDGGIDFDQRAILFFDLAPVGKVADIWLIVERFACGLDFLAVASTVASSGRRPSIVDV